MSEHPAHGWELFSQAQFGVPLLWLPNLTVEGLKMGRLQQRLVRAVSHGSHLFFSPELWRFRPGYFPVPGVLWRTPVSTNGLRRDGV